MNKWTRILYQPNKPLKEHNVTCSKEHIALSLQAAEEGMVLLKNEAQTLPLKKGAKIALFGKGTFDYVKGGGGSGDVYTSYVRNIYEGFKKTGCVQIYEPVADFYRGYVEAEYAGGAAAGMFREPDVTEELVCGAKNYTDTAIITLSRFSGEGWDRSSVDYDGEYNPWESEVTMPQLSEQVFPDMDFYLSKEEKKLIEQVTGSFAKVIVVLNVGGVVDTSWIKDNEHISAALLAWQAGMEGGLAMARILCGLVNPSGKLPDTFAKRLDDYPSTEHFHESPHYAEYEEDIYVGYRYFETIKGAAEAVVYPFGYGLSYTDFMIQTTDVWEEEDKINLLVRVTNIGKCAGKEVVQIYYGAPQGKLQKPHRALYAFEKTQLLAPGESRVISFVLDKKQMASYDDLGKIAKSAYVLEAGDYKLYVGISVRDALELETVFHIDKDTVVEQLSQHLAPTALKRRLLADGTYEELPVSESNDMNACAFEKMLPGTEEAIVPQVRARDQWLLIKPYGENHHPLMDVFEGKLSADEFIAQLTDDELLHLLGGQPNLGVANTWGIGNLPEYGIPSAMTADGPAGVRLSDVCEICTTAWPCATLLASTWDTELVRKVGEAGGAELKENNLAIWLTPAVNIHRNPLCGRNFEYYSEDPYLTGKMGSAMVQGIQSNGVGAEVKHFACNNKETNRKNSDSRVSERALREIYLKGFEMIVREADPWLMMSAYNAINGYRASECKELLEDILRGEWGFRGLVTTDWWNRGEHYKEIKAGNDVKMAAGFPDRVKKAMELGELDRSDLEHCASRVIGLFMKLD